MARKAKGLSREKLAESLGVSPRYLSPLENENKKPSYHLLYRLVWELEIPADTIFYPEVENKSDQLTQFAQRLALCDEMDMNIVDAALTAILENKKKLSGKKLK